MGDAAIKGSLAGRVAIVTGAGQGVGRGIVLALAAAGARVTLMGRTVAKVEAVAAEIEGRGGTALAVGGDVKRLDDIERCVSATLDTFGAINVLVNNAQEVPLGPLLALDDANVQAAWESGPMATLRFMRLCHPHLRGGASS